LPSNSRMLFSSSSWWPQRCLRAAWSPFKIRSCSVVRLCHTFSCRTAAACIAVFIYILIPLCRLNTISTECTRKRQGNGRTPWQRAHWNSFIPIEISIGPFYTLKINVVLFHFDFIFMNVINLFLFSPGDFAGLINFNNGSFQRHSGTPRSISLCNPCPPWSWHQ